jgi:hypothetical protein
MKGWTRVSLLQRRLNGEREYSRLASHEELGHCLGVTSAMPWNLARHQD